MEKTQTSTIKSTHQEDNGAETSEISLDLSDLSEYAFSEHENKSDDLKSVKTEIENLLVIFETKNCKTMHIERSFVCRLPSKTISRTKFSLYFRSQIKNYLTRYVRELLNQIHELLRRISEYVILKHFVKFQ